MKTTHKKMVGALLAGLLIATVGTAFATGQTNDTANDATNNNPPQMPFGRLLGPYSYNLTDAQQTELEELMTSLREQNASPDEIRTAIQEKLDEFGVLDTQLDNEITQTEQRLTILNIQKELRNEGYSWDEINNIIEEEFGENVTGFSWNMMEGPGWGHRPHGELQNFIAGEDLEK